jgi:hypothetical protein
VVGGFFSKEARESSYAVVSVGTFPKLPIKKADANRVVVKKFKKVLRASQHAAIANCYREYNAKGGRIVTLQTGSQVLVCTCTTCSIIRATCQVNVRRLGTVLPYADFKCAHVCKVYLPRAVVLAVYADFPAAQKILLTGSACPVCFTPEFQMALALADEVRLADATVITYCAHLTIIDFNVTNMYQMVQKCYIYRYW